VPNGLRPVKNILSRKSIYSNIIYIIIQFYLQIAININTAGTPKAKGKHEDRPKHCTSFLSSGVTDVDIRDPALIEK